MDYTPYPTLGPWLLDSLSWPLPRPTFLKGNSTRQRPKLNLSATFYNGNGHFPGTPLKSQIRYPAAGLAPWTLAQYQDLDRTPNPPTLTNRILPTYLIYAPLKVGGCGEHRISDAAQLQKWSYQLNSVCHLNPASKAVVHLSSTAHSTPPLPTHFATALVSFNMVPQLASLSNRLPTPQCHQQSKPFDRLWQPLAMWTSTQTALLPSKFHPQPPSSFSTHPISNISNTRDHGVGATGIDICPKQSLPPMALKLVAPPG